MLASELRSVFTGMLGPARTSGNLRRHVDMVKKGIEENGALCTTDA